MGALLRLKVRLKGRNHLIEFVYGGGLYPFHRDPAIGGLH